MNDEIAVSERSVMRGESSPVDENLLHPVTLDFDRDSYLDSDPR